MVCWFSSRGEHATHTYIHMHNIYSVSKKATKCVAIYSQLLLHDIPMAAVSRYTAKLITQLLGYTSYYPYQVN